VLKRRVGTGDGVLLDGPAGFHAVDADGGRVHVLQRNGSVVLVGADGSLRTLAGATGQGGQLQGHEVVALTRDTLQTLDATSGRRTHMWRLRGPGRSAATAHLAGLYAGIAVCLADGQAQLIDVRTGNEHTLTLPGRITGATLESGGLFAAYRIGTRSRIRLVPLSTLRAMLR
jgi:hypothetical protein